MRVDATEWLERRKEELFKKYDKELRQLLDEDTPFSLYTLFGIICPDITLQYPHLVAYETLRMVRDSQVENGKGGAMYGAICTICHHVALMEYLSQIEKAN